MCGIAGVASLGSRPVAPASVKRMCDALAHRGPDDAGYAFFRASAPGAKEGRYWAEFADREFRHLNEHLPTYGGSYFHDEVEKTHFSLALGHRRLSIIDLSHYGHQPMASSDRRIWISYNGEIYNYRELRDELAAAGHVFRTRTDTEVLLHLWKEQGAACLSRLNGMFALAVYDAERNELTLARDRFGVKPVYYAETPDALLFASEIKGILASGLIESVIAPEAVVEYLTFQNTYGSTTLFEGVRLLEAGHSLTVRPGVAAAPIMRRYHRLDWSVDHAQDGHDGVHEQVAEQFSAAVTRQLVGDVEVGSYLSGGMDSGSIVAVAGRSIPRLMTFTAGFDLTNVDGAERGFDERAIAERLSHLLQTEHYNVVLHAGDMPAALERITWHMDDPRVGMCHQNWYVAKLASRFVKVCLAGAGGDELFGGYPWRYRQAIGAETFADFDQAYYRYWHRLLPLEELPQLLNPDLRELTESSEASFARVMHDAPAYDPRLDRESNMLQRALYFEFNTFLQGYLVTEDRISMAHSLETRVPFLDNDLAGLACRLPPSCKVGSAAFSSRTTGGRLETAEGKLVLRQAMERFLPREIVQQKKQGFSSPDENWYRGPSLEYIRSILLDRRTLDRPWFNPAMVRAKLDEHVAGQRNHRLLIWSLLTLEWLQRHYVDQTSRPLCLEAA